MNKLETQIKKQNAEIIKAVNSRIDVIDKNLDSINKYNDFLKETNKGRINSNLVEYINPDSLEMDIQQLRNHIVNMEENIDARINQQTLDFEQRIVDLNGYAEIVESSRSVDENRYKEKDKLIDKKYKKFVDETKEELSWWRVHSRQMQENLDGEIAYSRQLRLDQVDLQQVMTQRMVNIEERYISQNEILSTMSKDIQAMNQNPNADLNMIHDRINVMSETLGELEVDHQIHKQETKDSFRNLVHESKSEVASETSSINLNISPIKQDSKSSIVMFRKVKTCNIYGEDIKSEVDVVTHDPYVSGRYSFSVNLLIYNIKDGKITFLLSKRDVFHQLCPRHYDFAASGYVLGMETDPMHSMIRVIKKELGVKVTSDFLVEIFLLTWSPEHTTVDNIKKYSEGILYMVNDQDFIDIYNIDLTMLHPMTEKEIMNCTAKPDLLQLFSDPRLREIVYKAIMQKVLDDNMKDSKITQRGKEEDTSYDTKRSKSNKTSRNSPTDTPFSKTSYRAFSFAENQNKKSTTTLHGSYVGEDHESEDDYNDRDRKVFYNRKEEKIKIMLPDDSEENIMRLSKENGQVLYVQSKISKSELYLEELEISKILTFLRRSLELGKTSKKAIQLTDHMSDDVINKLEYIGNIAMQDSGISLEGASRLGGLRQGGSQSVKNLAVYKLLAYYVRPLNEHEMVKLLRTKVFPVSSIKFTDPTTIRKHFKEFMMATHIYVDRHLELVNMLRLYEHLNDEKKRFYPTHVFKKTIFLGQVDYFCDGFEDPEFAKRVLESIDLETRYKIHTLYDFVDEFFIVIKGMNKHFGPVSDHYNNILYGKKSKTIESSSNDKSKFKRYNRYKKQAVNMTMEEAMLIDEQDEVDAYEQELEEQDSSVSDESIDSDEEDSNSGDDDDSQRINNVQTQKPSTLQPGVCYNLAYKGKCMTTGCIYNHDPAAIKKFLSAKKPTDSPAMKTTKPSTSNSKPPSGDKRRA